MADHTAISWAESTWNPVTGCTRISPGCDHCYIERTRPLRMAHRRFDGDGVGSTTGVQLHPERLEIPLHWRKPRKVFVCSLADLFHDEVPDEYIARVWAVMALAPRHTFQCLTKRPARVRALLNSPEWRADVQNHIAWYENPAEESLMTWARWPLPNCWLGVTAENQQWADIRIPALLDTPAAVRWVSAEPLLGRIDLSRFLEADDAKYDVPPLNWVVTGGESGPGARPAHPDWFRSIRDQCQAAGVAFHHKQNGEWIEDVTHYPAEPEIGIYEPFRVINVPPDHKNRKRCAMHPAGMTALTPDNPFHPFKAGHPNWTAMRRVGKKAAGRLLDGREHNDYPEIGAP
nr:phage Gp37/Gp68 family protein [Mycobacterium marinum]